MSSVLKVSSDELQASVHDLENIVEEIRSLDNRLKSVINNLNDSWQGESSNISVARDIFDLQERYTPESIRLIQALVSQLKGIITSYTELEQMAAQDIMRGMF